MLAGMSAALRDREANILSSVNSMEECAAPLVSDAFSRIPVMKSGGGGVGGRGA